MTYVTMPSSLCSKTPSSCGTTACIGESNGEESGPDVADVASLAAPKGDGWRSTDEKDWNDWKMIRQGLGRDQQYR